MIARAASITIPIVIYTIAAAQEPVATGSRPADPGLAIRASIDRGVEFLLKVQKPDGSFGDVQNNSLNAFWNNPETPKAWCIATTGLAAMTLMQGGAREREASVRALDYVAANFDLKRPDDWDTDNTWGYIYGLESLSRGLLNKDFANAPKRDAWLKAASHYNDMLKKYQSPTGGWGYYSMGEAGWQPSWSTSFMTSTAILALVDAREAGIAVDAKVIDACVKAVKRCRLPNGAYSYDVMSTPQTGGSEYINQVKGSLGRIQVCNLALRRAGEKITDDDLEKGLDAFFTEHKFLDVARQKPIPHEAYYYNAGYFYYFGHYYASGVIELLPKDKRAKWADLLQKEIIKTQEKDGSMWDFYIANFQKQYGTSFGVMSLEVALRAMKG
ncbi:MAG: hypothetical protein HY286_07295 [Planctomycetes bacterium]|nr:hypothetical protein [Planctomycetota bacterium]